MTDKQLIRFTRLMQWTKEAIALGDLDHVAFYQAEMRHIVASISK